MLLASSLAVVVASRSRPFGARDNGGGLSVGLHPRLLRWRYFVALGAAVKRSGWWAKGLNDEL